MSPKKVARKAPAPARKPGTSIKTMVTMEVDGPCEGVGDAYYGPRNRLFLVVTNKTKAVESLRALADAIEKAQP